MAQREWFASQLWGQAVRDFASIGVRLESHAAIGEIKRSPAGRPVFTTLEYRLVNIVVTDVVPMAWDRGRGLGGVTTRWEGYDVCVISLAHAHGHQIPFVSVNTCVHELLHVLLNDVRENRPEGLAGDMRELRTDWYATRLWLFSEGAFIRESASKYLRRFE